MPARTAGHARSAEQMARTGDWVVPFCAALLALLTLQMSSLGFSPLLPAMQAEFHFSYAELGLFTGLYGLLAMVLSLPAGLAARRFGERRVLIAGLVVVGVGLVMLSLAGNFAAALAGRVVWTSGYRFAFVAVLTAVAVTCPPHLKGMSMGIFGSVASFASVVGAPLGGLMAARSGWRSGMVAFIGVTSAGVAVAWMLYRPRAAAPQSPASSHAVRGSALRKPIVWALAALVGVIGMLAFSVTFFVPSAARSSFGLDAAGAGWMISSGYVLAMFVNLGIGYVMDRYDKWTIMSLIAALLIPASLSMTTHDLATFRIATAATLALGFTATNQVYALAREVMDSHDAAGAMGVLSLGSGIFGYVGPQLLGVLRDRTGGFVIGWYVMAGAAALALLELLILPRWSRTADWRRAGTRDVAQ